MDERRETRPREDGLFEATTVATAEADGPHVAFKSHNYLLFENYDPWNKSTLNLFMPLCVVRAFGVVGCWL